ncbi:dockerin type I domain-containing protein [Diplocloster hominis]|uniref:dockerin type I domain-containing protein n=1 Tax=Diplocloster hominis TaxID=3079010 RepID=UPI0031BB4EB9
MQNIFRSTALALICSMLAVGAGGNVVDYSMADSDFSSMTGIPDTYTVTGTAEMEQSLVLEKGQGFANSGGAAWKAIPIDNTDPAAPHEGDVLHAKLQMYISADAVPADGAPVLKIAAFGASGGWDLLHLDSAGMQNITRGKLVTVCDEPGFDGSLTQHWSRTIQDGADGGNLQIELHNDMIAGTVEIVGLEIWATRDGSSVVFPAGNYTDWDKSANSGVAPYVRNVLRLEAGSSVSRTLDVDGAVDSAPHAGDIIGGSLTSYRCADDSKITVNVSSDHGTLLTASNEEQPWGGWDTVSFGGMPEEGQISGESERILITLANDSQEAVRVKAYGLTGTRPLDFDGNGSVDERDAEFMEQALAQGSTDLGFDLDQDGQFTAKDISCFRKFILQDADEFYLNLNHLDFMSEDITIDGQQMTVMNLYAEPNDRSDLSKGYHYVGDAQEGFACLDDTARAVVALAEHYRLYQDSHSLQEIGKMLEFVLYMQEEDGEFKNFLAKDEAGNYYKKDSASSYKTFGYWGSRGYTALAYGYEALGDSNPALKARVKSAMDLCVQRIDSEISQKYGDYLTVSGYSMPAWNLSGDNWVSSAAIGALAKHYELFPDNTLVKQELYRLGEALEASAFGGRTEYPLGGIMHFYGNSIDLWDEWGSTQVAALAMAGDICGMESWIHTARLAADSFLADLLISGRAYALTPNKQTYPQINYGTASYVDNLLKLSGITGEKKYAQWAGLAAAWWTGDNASAEGTAMFNQDYGYAFDGIVSADNVNLNSGAESVVEAVRVLARVLQDDTARQYLYAVKTDESTAIVIEAEDLYRTGPDTEYPLPYGSLNDSNAALVKKASSDPGLDENQVQTEQTVLPDAMQNGQWQEVYSNWQGRNAFFCEGVGHNNIRLYNGGELVSAVGVGGEGQLQPGDYVKLDFMALVQFDTNLSAQVFAVDDKDRETLIADDSQMIYSARTWYSGDNSVKTKAVRAIPEGTTHLKIRFSVTTTAGEAEYAKAYGTIVQAGLFKMASPEIQSGGSAYSKGSYAVMEAGSSKSFGQMIAGPGTYDVYISIGAVSEDSGVLSFGEEDNPNEIHAALQKNSGVQIKRLGRMELAEGNRSFVISNSGDEAVNLDAVILYPKITYVQYQTPSGAAVRMERDSGL